MARHLHPRTDIDRDTGLLARLVAPHVSYTGNMSHYKAIRSGRAKEIFGPQSLKSLAVEADLLARLSETICLTMDGFKSSLVSMEQQKVNVHMERRKGALSKDKLQHTGLSMVALSPNLLPRIVLKRPASAILSAKVRIADIRAPLSVGQLAHCRVWEGASGEIVLEAHFVNSTSDGSSSKGGVMRSFRTTWLAIRRLCRLPFFLQACA